MQTISTQPNISPGFLMTRRTVKQEKAQGGEVEEVIMTSSVRSRRKSKVNTDADDADMAEAPIISGSSFAAMPTPASLADDGTGLTNFSNQQDPDPTTSYNVRSAAPSAETGLHLVGHRVQVLVDAIQDFREFGVDHVVQLPELVLVGDQSAGKSSLMSALAEIHLPQSAGCCTRCPAHIKTTPADTWTCKISLEKEYSYEPISGCALELKDVTKAQPFPPWILRDLDVKPFITIREKSHLEEALKWAQIAILNDRNHHSQYIPGTDNFTDDETTEAKFSPNVVSIEISGPGLVPLSFYDLPGVFQNASHQEDQYLTNVVENLVLKYIRRPQALIICALPMSADPATSSTSKLIVKQNAGGRCMGVLTKADQLQEGQSTVDFDNMLQGKSYVLGHGYYATMQPGYSTQSVHDEFHHAKARQEEERFFNTSKGPWTDRWCEFRGRFGTTNLAQALSQKFAAQVVDSIPEIERKIAVRARQIENELRELPELPAENILQVILPCLNNFSSEFRNVLDGGASYNSFQSSWAKLCSSFRETILEIKPRIIVSHPSDFVLPEVINLDDDGDENMDQNITDYQSTRKRMNEETPTPQEKKQRLDNRMPPQYDGANGERKPNGTNGLPLRNESPNATRTPRTPIFRKRVQDEEPNPFAAHIKACTTRSNIEEIRTRISRHSKTGIPGIVNDQVYSEMCMESVTPWEGPLEQMVDMTLKMLREQGDQILVKALSQWQQTQLFRQCRQHISAFFDDLEKSQREDADAIFKLEHYRLFTVNTLAWEKYREEEGEILRTSRKYCRARAYVEKELTLGKKQFRDDGAKKKCIAEVKDEQLGKDPFAAEIEVAAYVRGYYKTAALRFVDSVCLSFHGKLFRNARKEIFYFLEKKLGLNTGNGEQICRELMEENAQVAVRRAKLKKESESVKKFTTRLNQLAADNAALDDHDSYDANMDIV